MNSFLTPQQSQENLHQVNVNAKAKSMSMSRPLLTATLVALSSTLILSGCQATKGWLGKRDNGSLNYQNSKKLAPLVLPAEQEAAAFIPLYPTPEVGGNTLTLTNEAGKQFKLPPPERAVALPNTPN
ncbi:MAG: hypothetical protein Q4P13_01215 [Psychrobacter sp.]|nr:hypothetical protein [Psychrobacter sp.]